MKKSMKKIAILGLAALMLYNVTPSICFASESRPVEEEISTRKVIDSYTISAAKCKKIYQEMGEYNGWTATLASSVVSLMGIGGTIVGGAISLAGAIQKWNFDQTKKEFKKGADSGKGCKIIVYDNAAPLVMAL